MAKRIVIKVLKMSGDSALIEYEQKGKIKRAYLPISDIQDDRVDPEALDLAIPYGVPWAALLDLSDLTPERVELELHKYGIWTLQDLENKDRILIRIGTDLITKAVRAASEKG